MEWWKVSGGCVHTNEDSLLELLSKGINGMSFMMYTHMRKGWEHNLWCGTHWNIIVAYMIRPLLDDYGYHGQTMLVHLWLCAREFEYRDNRITKRDYYNILIET